MNFIIIKTVKERIKWSWKEKLNSGSYRIRFNHPVEHKKKSVFVQFAGNAKETEQQAKLKKVEIET